MTTPLDVINNLNPNEGREWKKYFIIKEVYISDMKIYTTRLYIESNLTYQVEVNEFFFVAQENFI